jgi:uncharacterized protein (TIGR03083 family)
MFDLERVRASWQRERDLIDAMVRKLDDAQGRQPIRDDGWTTHDLLGHVAQATGAFLRQLQPDQALPSGVPVNVDQLNAQARERNINRPWPEVLAYWQRARDEMTTFLHAAPADVGEQSVHVPWQPEITTAGDLLRLLILHTRSHREELEQGWQHAQASSR